MRRLLMVKREGRQPFDITGGPSWTRIEHYASRRPLKFVKSLRICEPGMSLTWSSYLNDDFGQYLKQEPVRIGQQIEADNRLRHLI